MIPTVGQIMQTIRRYFEAGPPVEGDFTLAGGHLAGPSGLALCPGDWIAVCGAGAASGVYCADDSGCLPGAPDAVFSGRVWRLDPPGDFLRLCREIAAWCEAHPRTSLKAERFGEYSHAPAVNAAGTPLGWQQIFAS